MLYSKRKSLHRVDFPIAVIVLIAMQCRFWYLPLEGEPQVRYQLSEGINTSRGKKIFLSITTRWITPYMFIDGHLSGLTLGVGGRGDSGGGADSFLKSLFNASSEVFTLSKCTL